MGCDVINGYMHFLEETYNNGGKNKFFAHQFFINVIEDEATFEKVVNKQDFKKGWAKWEKLFFPLQHNNHWFLIVADKVKEEILVYDSLAHYNKHHSYGVKKLIDRQKTKKGNEVVDTQQLRDKEVFQRQHDGVNCGYFTCWYAHQVVTNQPVAGWSGNYHEEVQKVRENIMCSLVHNAIVTEEAKHIVWNN